MPGTWPAGGSIAQGKARAGAQTWAPRPGQGPNASLGHYTPSLCDPGQGAAAPTSGPGDALQRLGREPPAALGSFWGTPGRQPTLRGWERAWVGASPQPHSVHGAQEHSPVHYPTDESGSQGPLFSLDNNHSHFILVEPGAPGKGDGPTELWLRLEKHISEQRTGYGGETAREAAGDAGWGTRPWAGKELPGSGRPGWGCSGRSSGSSVTTGPLPRGSGWGRRALGRDGIRTFPRPISRHWP